MTTRTYETKTLAQDAARAALKADGVKDPMSAVHYQLDQQGEEWAWHEMNLTTGEVATGERLAEGVRQGPLVPVTVIPAKGSKPATPTAAPKVKPKAPATISAREQRRLDKIAAATAKANAPKQPKAPAAPKAPKAPKQPNVRHLEAEAAKLGKLPTAPDFSKPTHQRWAKRLGEIVAMVKARDVKGLKADKTQPLSSSRVMLCRYRDNAITALTVKAGKAAKAAPAKKAA